MLFLIPVAAVGYAVWEKMKGEDQEAEEGGTNNSDVLQTPQEPIDPMVIVTTDDKGNVQMQEGDVNDTGRKEEDEKGKKQNPWGAIRRFFTEQNENEDPFAIKANPDTLTYEVLGNRGDKALPFPKISYK